MGKFFALFTAASLIGASSALAGSPFTVEVDHSQLVMLDGEPAAVVVGNPGIADVTLNGKQLFVHGHAYGETNVMLFKGDGSKLLDFDVTVKHHVSNNEVAVYSAGSFGPASRSTYTCSPDCEAATVAGDNTTFTSTAIGSSNQIATMGARYSNSSVLLGQYSQ